VPRKTPSLQVSSSLGQKDWRWWTLKIFEAFEAFKIQ
jgi:hypothetical protein